MAWYHKITDIGLHHLPDARARRAGRIINAITAVAVLAMIANTVTILRNDTLEKILPVPFVGLAMVVSVLSLNSKGYFTAGKILFFVVACAIMFYLSLLLDMRVFIALFTIVLTIFPSVIFTRMEKNWRILLTIIPPVLLLTLHFTDFTAPFVEKQVIDLSLIRQLRTNIIIVTCSVVILMIYSFTSSAEKYEDILQKAINNLEDQKAIVHIQKESLQELYDDLHASEEEIRQNLEELNSINDHLERNYAEMRTQKDLLSSKNRETTDSIEYARQIQNSFLPPALNMQAVLGSHCLFFRPRDIVSGDFYWMHAISQHQFVLVVSDCTGHGVPGAFMSVLGNSLLTSIVVQEQLTAPDLILNKLHRGIRDSLKQGSSKNRDGMDIALIYVDKQTQTIDFAGARSPLIILPPDEELQYIDSSRMGVGGYYRKKSQFFTNYHINYTSGTRLYMSSDGFQDQFGGMKGRKLMSKRFRSLIDSFRYEPMEKQENLFARPSTVGGAAKNK